MEADNEHKYYWFNAQTSYALEVNAGWFSKAGVSVGDKINLQFLKNYSDID